MPAAKARKLTSSSYEEQCCIPSSNRNMCHAQQDCITGGSDTATDYDEGKAMFQTVS
jgi:hypothetical protein